MPEDQFTFVHAGTLGEPLNMEVRKAGLTIGRILHLWTYSAPGRDLRIPQGHLERTQ
jgi:hypothetical protein